MSTLSFFVQNFLLPALAGILVFVLLSLKQISLRKRWAIAGAVFLVALLVSASVSRPLHRSPEPRLVVEGTVVDAASNSGIGQAVVSLSDGGRSCTSVDNGNFLLDLTGEVQESSRVRISVTKNGYMPFDGTATVPAHDFVVQLRHL